MILVNQQNFTANSSVTDKYSKWSMESGLVVQGIPIESEDSLFKP